MNMPDLCGLSIELVRRVVSCIDEDDLHILSVLACASSLFRREIDQVLIRLTRINLTQRCAPPCEATAVLIIQKVNAHRSEIIYELSVGPCG